MSQTNQKGERSPKGQANQINKETPNLNLKLQSQPQPNINDTFFKGLYKEVWRRLIPPGLSEAECSFIEEVAELQKGDRVLDLLCGYGRHTIPLAKAGYLVTAIDNAEDYIIEINSTATAAQLSVEAITATVTEADFVHQYKAVICMGNSFAFFNRADAIQLLKKIAAHLLPGGIFIINSWMIAEIAIRHFKEREWINVDGFKYLMQYCFQFHPHRIESEHTIINADGTIEEMKGVDYIFSLSELELLFKEAGLTANAIYSTPKKRSFKMGDNTVYLVIKKLNND